MKYLVLVDLPSIIDVRLNLINYLLGRDVTEDETFMEEYLNRQSDNFMNVPYKLYNLLASYGNKHGLTKPILTKIFDVMVDGFFKQKEANVRVGTDTEVVYELSVNIYPYNLTGLERSTILRGIRVKLPGFVNIKLIDKPYNESLIGNFNTLYLYEGVKVLTNIISLNDKFKHNGELFTPALILDRITFKGTIINQLFEDMKEVYSIFTNISFINQDVYTMKKE